MDCYLDIFGSDNSSECNLPLSLEQISAGFPSPADDYMDLSLDLNKELIKNPSSTFFAKVKGNSMIGDGINDGDLLVIDKSLTPVEGSVVVAFVDGEFTLKEISSKGGELWLMPSNPNYKPIKIEENNNFIIWGIVTYVIKKFK